MVRLPASPLPFLTGAVVAVTRLDLLAPVPLLLPEELSSTQGTGLLARST